MPHFLDKILFLKKREVEDKKSHCPLPELFRNVTKLPPPLSFSPALLNGKTIIAEIKKASPSKGYLFFEHTVEDMGRIYQKSGASAVSVVTDGNYFQGDLRDITHLKKTLEIPILRKDFLIDEYQILESRQSGADAILLIASLLSRRKLRILLDTAKDLEMEALVEVHTKHEIQLALKAGADIIGINNRDLKTLTVNVNTAKFLLPMIPDSKIKVVESGIKDEEDLLSYKKFQVNAFLIGEALITAPDPGERLKAFCAVLRNKDEN